MNELRILIKRLRSPLGGCPWDQKQTPASIRNYIIEEAYELKEAIDEGSIDGQKEESGDLLLQIVLLAAMHQEKGHFSLTEVVNGLIGKLISRHPHIFEERDTLTPGEVSARWEEMKKRETGKKSILSDYPPQMPALITAYRLGQQAASVGFDWKKASEAMDKIREETVELSETVKSGSKEKQREEIGDLLLATVNVARILRIHPEDALKESIAKFTRRFRHMEKKAPREKMAEMTLQQLESLWNESKKKESL